MEADSEPQLRCHRISAHGFRSAIASDKPECPHCHRRGSSISNARHHVRHQSCQRSGACMARAAHCEVAWTKDLHLPPLPGLDSPVIASPPTELASKPVNHADFRVHGNSQEAQDGGSCRGQHHRGEFRHPNLTYRLRNLEGITRRHDYEIRSLTAWSSDCWLFNPIEEPASLLLKALQTYNGNKPVKGPHAWGPPRRALRHAQAEWLVPRLSQQSPFTVFHEKLTQPEEVEALSIQMFVARLTKNRANCVERSDSDTRRSCSLTGTTIRSIGDVRQTPNSKCKGKGQKEDDD